MNGRTVVNIGEQRFDRVMEENKFYIEEKQYEAELIAEGFSKEQIRKYGFAFKGKTCLIG